MWFRIIGEILEIETIAVARPSGSPPGSEKSMAESGGASSRGLPPSNFQTAGLALPRFTGMRPMALGARR